MAHKGWYYESLNSDSEDGMGARGEDKVGKGIRGSNQGFLEEGKNKSSGLGLFASSLHEIFKPVKIHLMSFIAGIIKFFSVSGPNFHGYLFYLGE